MKRTMAEAFNEWMRRYIETPEQFKRDWQMVQQYTAETAQGYAPTYGDVCTAYLLDLIEGK